MHRFFKKMGIAVFFLFFLLFVSPVVVFADMGPKPSIDIMFENLNQRIYVTLLSEDKSTGPYSVFDEEHETLDDVFETFGNGLEKEDYLRFIEYEDQDGFYFLKIVWVITPENNVLHWGYYPPSCFKILLFDPLTDTFLSGAKTQRYAFKSYFKVDLENFEPTVEEILPPAVRNYDYAGEIGSLLVRIILTVFIELGVAVLFFFGKKVFLKIVFVNVVTQVLLNLFLNWIYYQNGSLAYGMAYLPLEFLIILIESVVYSILFTKTAIKRPVLKAILYSVFANAASFAVGILLWRYLPFAF